MPDENGSRGIGVSADELLANLKLEQDWTRNERRRVRELAKVSLREIAVALDVSHPTAAALENNVHVTKTETGRRYIDLLEQIRAIVDNPPNHP